MKTQIAIFEYINPVSEDAHYTIVPSQLTGTGQLGPMKVVELDSEEAKDLFERQMDSIRLQMVLQNLFHKKEELK